MRDRSLQRLGGAPPAASRCTGLHPSLLNQRLIYLPHLMALIDLDPFDGLSYLNMWRTLAAGAPVNDQPGIWLAGGDTYAPACVGAAGMRALGLASLGVGFKSTEALHAWLVRQGPRETYSTDIPAGASRSCGPSFRERSATDLSAPPGRTVRCTAHPRCFHLRGWLIAGRKAEA